MDSDPTICQAALPYVLKDLLSDKVPLLFPESISISLLAHWCQMGLVRVKNIKYLIGLECLPAPMNVESWVGRVPTGGIEKEHRAVKT